MGYVDENVLPGESVVHSTRLHWFVFVPPVVLFVIGALLAAWAQGDQEFAFISPIGGFLIVVAILLFFIRLVEYFTSEFAVTTKRVIIKVGLIRRRTLELLLEKVETVGVDQPVLGRLFGFGTIIVTGTGGTREPFSTIAGPMEFRRHVQEQIAQGLTSGSGHVPTATPVGSGGVLCTACGTRNAVGSNFCASCGGKVASA